MRQHLKTLIVCSVAVIVCAIIVYVSALKEPHAMFIVDGDVEGIAGLFDMNGKEILPCDYGQITPYSEGLAPAFEWNEEKSENYWGAVDESGNVVIPFIYDRVYPFTNGLALVRQNDRVGCIDKTGQVVIPIIYHEFSGMWLLGDGDYFNDGLLLVCAPEPEPSQWGFLDKNGNEVVPVQYDSAHPFTEGLAAVQTDGKWGYVDKTGQVVIPIQYDDTKSFSEGLAAVELDDKWGYVDKTGQVVLPVQYDDAGSFSEGLAVVEIDGKWGYVDKTGKAVIPCQFDLAGSFSESLAAVCAYGQSDTEQSWGYIDKTGKVVIPLQYTDAHSFSEGLAAVSRKIDESFDNWGYIDKTGKEAIPLIYGSIRFSSFHEGFAVCAVIPEEHLDSLLGVLDKSGKVIVPFEYMDISYANAPLLVEKDGRRGILDNNGNIDWFNEDMEPKISVPTMGNPSNVESSTEETEPATSDYKKSVEVNTDEPISVYTNDDGHYIYGGEFFDTLQAARGQYDIVKILGNGQRDISWTTVKITENLYDTEFTFDYEYPIFNTLPNEEFTVTINRIIKDIVCYSYDHYERNGPYNWTENNTTGIKATVMFANPELVIIRVFILANSHYSAEYYLKFSPTTGERYTLHNFMEISPDFVSKYIILPGQISTHDLELIIYIFNQKGMEGLSELLLEQKEDYSDWEDEFWDIDMARWFVNRYKEFYNEVDVGYPNHYSWIDQDGLHLESSFRISEPTFTTKPFAELEPYLYKDN